MAALTGSLTADFSQFATEVDRSVTKLHELERAGGTTNSAMGGFAEGLSAVDRTLGAVGIHIGPQIAALRELGNVAGLTFDKLGLLGGVSLAAGLGAATYQITTMALEFTGLNKAIENVVDSLSGFNAERAAAGMDVLNRATQIAGRTITDFGVAMKIIQDHNRGVAESFNTGSDRVRRWGEDIAKVRKSGDLETITKELKEGSSTVKQLAERFNISAEAITYYTKRSQESSAILEKLREKERADLAKMKAAQDEVNNAGLGWQKTVEAIAPATAALALHNLSLNVSLESVALTSGLTTTQVKALETQLKYTTATLALAEPALGTLDQFMRGLPPSILEAGKATQFFDAQLMASIATVEQEATPAIEKLEDRFHSLTEAVREAAAPVSKNAPGSVAMNLGGTTFGAGGLEAAMAAYTARFGTSSAAGAIGGGPAKDFLSWAMSMGYATKGTSISNNFNIVDTESEIARRVSEEINRQIRAGSLMNVS